MAARSRATCRSTQERYDNLVFPRGGGPGLLAGRGGGPNVTAGAQTFATTCAKCHRFGAVGKDYGPDLSKIGQTMLRRDILRSIFFPTEKVDPKYHATVIVTRDSRRCEAWSSAKTRRRSSLKTAEDVEPVSVEKSEIAKRTKERMSIMPDDLPDRSGTRRFATSSRT